ncbi:flagellar hook-length control protein FliK [Salirhabdus sp. Marseille-P4669]|uniref:flagellar hook-length control protein FliK n=1 Tax=Salirhabdus sp. Marseille-P4669 TaxID=2042310 RepID=UPI000C7D7BAC|nr:flagellar hook-length control protein FliK [Salirhabdus sp. Marseille-P4669]
MNTTPIMPYMVNPTRATTQVQGDTSTENTNTSFMNMFESVIAKPTGNVHVEEKSKISTDSLVSLLEQLEQLLQGEQTAENEGELDALLNQLLSMLTDQNVQLESSLSGDENTESVLGYNMLFSLNRLTPNESKAPINAATGAKFVETLLTIYEGMKQNPTSKGLVEKLELTLGKLVETLNQANLAKDITNKLEGSKHEKAWNSILNALTQKVSTNGTQPATATDQNKQLQRTVANVLAGIPLTDASHQKVNNQVNVDSMPMTKIEQYTIYVQRQPGTEQTGSQKQLLDQFEQAIKSSRFLQKDGALQLTLKLRPAHLGDMVVKLTQVNGEMAVKISVASTAAKELLESNMNQLRHMFSPNQVVIEKQSDPILNDLPSHFTNEENKEEQNQNQHLFQDNNEMDEEELDKEGTNFRDILFQTQT